MKKNRNRPTKILIITLVLVALASVVLRLITPAQQTKFDQTLPMLNKVIPGSTTAKELLTLQGNPKQILTNDRGFTNYQYESSYTNLPTQVLITNDRVTATIQRVSPENANNYEEVYRKLGKPDLRVYGDFGITFPIDIFLAKGIGIARSHNGFVSEIWRFLPTDAESFLSNFKSLTIEPVDEGPEPFAAEIISPTPTP